MPRAVAQLIAGCALLGACAGVDFIPSGDKNVQLVGRFEEMTTSQGPQYAFDWAACEIRVQLVIAAEAAVAIELAQKHGAVPAGAKGNSKHSGFEANGFVVYINGTRMNGTAGKLTPTFLTSKDQTEAPYRFNLSSAPLPPGTHVIRVVKATEPDWNGGDPVPNYVTFSGFAVTTTGSSAAGARTAPGAKLPTRKIEFLGDSITAGYCNECQKHSGADHNEAAGSSWDVLMGGILNAQVHTQAWSGLGMVHNCCGGNTTMPTLFNRTLATLNINNTWDFARWTPDALVINLGTNDGKSALSPAYTSTYTELVLNAARIYGSKLHVFLACGPMSETYCQPIENVIDTVTKQGVQAHLLDQRGFLNGTFGRACCGHPGSQVDAAMADSGAAFIREELGW